MNIKYTDIHMHLNLSPLKENMDEVISRMHENSVGGIIIGVDLETSKEAIQIAEKYDFIYAGVGLHPTDNVQEDFDIEEYEKIAKNERVVCVGECGLDYFRDASAETKEKQKSIFIKQVELALRVNKTLMIHARPSSSSSGQARPSKNTMPARQNHSGGDAYEDVLDILENYKKEYGEKVRANFHFFVGDMSIAKRIVENNFTVSFDGPITFARDYDEVIRFFPLENIMCETDAPFAAPLPYRGETCEPFMVLEVYKKIAEIKGIPEEEVALKIKENIKKAFGI